jgi:hypothetical protein
MFICIFYFLYFIQTGPKCGIQVKGLGYKLCGLGFEVKGLGFTLCGLGFEVKALHFAVQGLR